jgi:hypothetical protein
VAEKLYCQLEQNKETINSLLNSNKGGKTPKVAEMYISKLTVQFSQLSRDLSIHSKQYSPFEPVLSLLEAVLKGSIFRRLASGEVSEEEITSFCESGKNFCDGAQKAVYLLYLNQANNIFLTEKRVGIILVNFGNVFRDQFCCMLL